MDMLPAFGGDDLRKVAYGAARVAVLPVPYEGTVSYGRGAAGGPHAILEASAPWRVSLLACTEHLDALNADDSEAPSGI